MKALWGDFRGERVPPLLHLVSVLAVGRKKNAILGCFNLHTAGYLGWVSFFFFFQVQDVPYYGWPFGIENNEEPADMDYTQFCRV